MFETETFGPYLVRKLKWEGFMAPLAPPPPPPARPPVAMPLIVVIM